MTTADLETETRLRTTHFDNTLLPLNSEEEAFLKSETGIQDTEELKKHIIEVQEDAYKVSRCSHAYRINLHGAVTDILVRVQVYPYPCIRGFGFARLRISRLPAYPRVLELGKSRPDAIFLDVGCCRKDRLLLGVCFDS